jgi:hypothetical protein
MEHVREERETKTAGSSARGDPHLLSVVTDSRGIVVSKKINMESAGASSEDDGPVDP